MEACSVVMVTVKTCSVTPKARLYLCILVCSQ